MFLNTNRIWLISDLHFGVRSNSLDWLDIQKSYFYDWFIPLIKEKYKESDILFVLGDTFDNRTSINTLVMNVALDIFVELSKILPIFILAGNHDLYKKSTNDVNSIKIFNHIKNIKVFEESELVKTSDKSILIMPWQANPTVECEVINNHSADYLFCHTSYQGASYNHYTFMNDGNTLQDFSKFKTVYSGHIHYRQEQDNFNLIGCPYQLTRSDINNKKGVYLLDLKNDNKKFFENDFSPKFLKIKLEDVLEMSLEEYRNFINNNFVDVLCESHWSLTFPFNNFLELSDNYKKLEIKLLTQEEIDNSNIESDEEISQFNILKLIKMYIENTKHPIKVKEVIEKKVQELYNRSILDYVEDNFTE